MSSLASESPSYLHPSAPMALLPYPGRVTRACPNCKLGRHPGTRHCLHEWVAVTRRRKLPGGRRGRGGIEPERVRHAPVFPWTTELGALSRHLISGFLDDAHDRRAVDRFVVVDRHGLGLQVHLGGADSFPPLLWGLGSDHLSALGPLPVWSRTRPRLVRDARPPLNNLMTTTGTKTHRSRSHCARWAFTKTRRHPGGPIRCYRWPIGRRSSALETPQSARRPQGPQMA